MKLVWHATGLFESDWLRFLLGDLVEQEIVDLELTCVDDETIHVISSIWTPLLECISYFQTLRSRCKHIVLINVADEWFSGGYQTYQYFDLVLRNYHTHLASSPGIITIPLGYANNTVGSLRPADRRKYVWSFTGAFKASRLTMIKAFVGLRPQFLLDTGKDGSTQVSKSEYDRILEESTFAPCPMGNVIIDTWRLYESLELGCIPLLERRISLDYYANLLGRNPLPVFRSWAEARSFAESMNHDKSRLLATQAEISQWWQAYKTNFSKDIRTAITGPSHSADLQRYAASFRNRNTLVHEPLRIAELLRHQSAASLFRRLANPVGPLVRIVADLSGGRLATARSVATTRARNKDRDHA